MKNILKLVCSFVLVCASLAMLSNCGGGSGSPVNPGNGNTIINPPETKYFGAIKFGYGGNYCEAGYGGGIATGYRTQSAANAAALNQCNTTNSECDSDFVPFGSGYFGDNDCEALAYGRSGGDCNFSISDGAASLSAAELGALDNCRRSFTSCKVIASACSTSGPERATPFSRGPDAPSNRRPEVRLNIDDVTLRQGEKRRIRNVSSYFYDPDGDRLTINASDGNEFLATVRKDGDDLIITGVNEFNGAVTITVIARDPAGLSAKQTFEVRVTPPPNRAPVVRVGFPDVDDLKQGGTSTYRSISGNFSDPDGDRLSFSAQTSSPSHATAMISGDDLIITGVQAFTTGAVTITVTARDPSGLSVSTRFSVRVTGSRNRAPVVRVGFPDVDDLKQGGTSTYRNISGNFSDPDGDRLSFSAQTSSPSHATAMISGDDLIITGVQAFTTGAVTITVTARDPSGLSVSTSFRVRVTWSPPKIIFETDDRCNDGRDVEMRFSYFSGSRFINWASSLRIARGANTVTEVNCNYSNVDRVCYGAQIKGTNWYWGHGTDGTQRPRSNNCWSCPSSGETRIQLDFYCPSN